MIPVVWNQASCVLSGSVYKFVDCEKCKQKYVYRMSREGEGSGATLYYVDTVGTMDRAKSEAAAHLKKQLDSDCDAVPCIACGHFQENMVAKLRSEHQYWMNIAAILVAVCMVVFTMIGLFMNPDPELAAIILLGDALLGITAGGLVVLRKRLANKLEPNDLPVNDRLKIGNLTAYSIDAFTLMLKNQGVEWQQPPTDSQVAEGAPPAAFFQHESPS